MLIWNRGASYAAKGHLERAVQDYTEALILRDDYAYAYFGRSAAYSKNGDLDAALKDLDKTVELGLNSPIVYVVRASVHIDKGDFDIAIQDCEQALDLDQDCAEAHTILGIAYFKKGTLDLAIREFDKALIPKPDKAAYANRGIAWLHTSEWEKARVDLITARNMGMDLVEAFQTWCESVEAFELKNKVKLPGDIAEMVSIKEPLPQHSGTYSVLEMFQEIRESAPEVNWDELPSDGAKNYKHYLYGHPKE